MTRQAMLNASIGLGMMALIVTTYGVLVRRYHALWHPLSIFAAVVIVSIAVSVLGEVVFGSGWIGASTVLRRSAIGGFGWGVVIALGVWCVRRGYMFWAAHRGHQGRPT